MFQSEKTYYSCILWAGKAKVRKLPAPSPAWSRNRLGPIPLQMRWHSRGAYIQGFLQVPKRKSRTRKPPKQQPASMDNNSLYGKWESYKSENLEIFFEKLGMGWLKQKIGPKLTSSLVLEKLSDSELKLSVSSLGFHDETVFKVDGVVPWSGGAKDMHDALTKWEDGKLVIYCGPLNSASQDDIKANVRVKIVREIVGDGELLMTIIHPEVTATRYYKRKE